MNFPNWQSFRRNWLAGTLGLLITVGLIAGATILVPIKYVTTSQMVLLPPLSEPNANYNGVVNPYMGLAGLQSMAAVVSSAMMDDETAQQLKAAGVSSYSVQYNSLSAGPILIVQATEPSPSQASNAIAVLDKQVPLTVANLQKEASVAPRSFISAKVIAQPTIPSKSTKTELRVVGLALMVGIVLTLLAVSAMDGWRTRRRHDSRNKNSHDRVASLLSASAETTRRKGTETEGRSEKSSTVMAPLSSDNSDNQAPTNGSMPNRTRSSL